MAFVGNDSAGTPHVHDFDAHVRSGTDSDEDQKDFVSSDEEKGSDPFAPAGNGLVKDGLESHMRRTSIAEHSVDDLGADLYLEAEQMGLARLEQLNKRVRWKLDLIIMPIVASTHALQFLNKSSPNFVAALGIIPELGLGHGRYAWVSRFIIPTRLTQADVVRLLPSSTSASSRGLSQRI